MYEFYSLYILGVEYNYWVHGYFGLVLTFIVLRWIEASQFNFNSLMVAVCVLTTVLGVSAAHELYEFAGAVLLSGGEGVLFIGTGGLSQWDTQKDMLINVIGGVIDVFIHELTGLVR